MFTWFAESFSYVLVVLHLQNPKKEQELKDYYMCWLNLILRSI